MDQETISTPRRLDGIILTHKHLDHSNDVNILIEAMTDGGFNKKGVLFCPEDAITEDPVVMRYARGYIERVELLKEKKTYAIKDVTFTTPVRHVHGVETYGLVFQLNASIGLSPIPDSSTICLISTGPITSS